MSRFLLRTRRSGRPEAPVFTADTLWSGLRVLRVLARRERRPYIPAMFETIRAELTTATDKLTHLRRFL